MGMLSVVEPRLVPTPNTPPHPGLPKLSVSLSSWKSAGPISPPMSHHEPSPLAENWPRQIMDDRRDGSKIGVAASGSAPPAAPRQQLPPLSSLFGLPSQMGLLHSSPADVRPSPYLAPSPLDRPRAGNTEPERSVSGSSSYFSAPLPSLSQPRSMYEPRHVHEQGTYPRSMAGPISPRMRDGEHSRPDSGSDLGSSSCGWSAHRDSNRLEYSLGRSRQHHHSTSRPGSKQQQRDTTSRETGVSQHPVPPPMANSTMAPSKPPPPPSPAVEGAPAKDGLGPKIWTGTHFLPRFVRAAEVPGEGMCYFYDDGSHCKTVIDGEAVNALWGVTKAGKPRKRLAIACVTCREKKIKCDPDYPRCLQCDKFGRVCRFKNAPRGGYHSAGNSPRDGEESRQMMIGGPAADVAAKASDPHGRPNSQSSKSLSPKTHMIRPASPEPPVAKRPRIRYEMTASTRKVGSSGSTSSSYMASYDSVATTSAKTSFLSSWRQEQQQQQQQQQQQADLPRVNEDVLTRSWQADPYVTDPQSVITVISSFFARVESYTALSFLPEKPFVFWVQSIAHKKSPEDLMLIYSILALGVILSQNSSSTTSVSQTAAVAAAAPAAASTTIISSSSNHTATAGGMAQSSPIVGDKSNDRHVGFDYSQVARFASDRARLSIQLVQARLLLSVYYLATSRRCESSDMLNRAISAATAMQLNLEINASEDEAGFGGGFLPYALTRAGYQEMRRRTFWSCFVLERTNGMFPTRLGIINADDVFLRMPMAWASFEAQADDKSIPAAGGCDPESPFSGQPVAGGGSTADPMASLIQIAAIWGDVMTTAYRIAHHRRRPEQCHDDNADDEGDEDDEDFDLDYDFAEFHRKTSSRLARWQRSNLPQDYAAAWWEGAAERGELGVATATLLLYHLTQVELNRHVHMRFLLQHDQKNNKPDKNSSGEAATTTTTTTTRLDQHDLAHVVRQHAGEILRTIAAAMAAKRPGTAIPAPQVAHQAVMEAVDVATAAGRVEDIPGLLDRLEVAREVAADTQQNMLHRIASLRRLHDLTTVVARFSPYESPVEGCVLTAAAAAGARGGAAVPGAGGWARRRPQRQASLSGPAAMLPLSPSPDNTNTPDLAWRMLHPLDTSFPMSMDIIYLPSSGPPPS